VRTGVLIPPPTVLPGDPPLPPILAEGLQWHRRGDSARAEKAYRSWLRAQPDHPQATAFCAVSYAQTGDLVRAERLLRKAISLAPGLGDARYALGNVLRAAGRSAEAVTLYAQAHVLGHPDAGKSLDEMLAHTSVTERSRVHRLLAQLFLSRARCHEALEQIMAAIALERNNADNWRLSGHCLAGIRFASFPSTAVVQLLVEAWSRREVDHQLLTGATVSLFRLDPDLTEFVTHGDINSVFRSVAFVLLVALLTKSFVTEPWLEDLLTVLRRSLLASLTDACGGPVENSSLPLVCALAVQCFNNEYIFARTPQEQTAVDELRARITARLDRGEGMPPAWIGLLGCYESLHGFSQAEKLLEHDWPVDLRSVLAKQISEPIEEARLRAGIPQLTTITLGVSSDVREQYEENPYPRWLALPGVPAPALLEEWIRQTCPRFRRLQPDQCTRAPELLVAGCGTGQSTLALACSVSGGRVTALDLSRASLAYAVRMSREQGIHNVEFFQADILSLGNWKRCFDHVDCFGVLHHLAEPIVGWRILTSLLRPGGTMYIGLYSEIGRQGVVAARGLVSRRGYAATPEGMRSSRAEIRSRAKTDPALRTLVDSWAFYNMSNYRDLVFHVQEQRYTLPKIGDMLRELGLELIGIAHTDPTVQQRYCARFPGDTDQTNLNCWHQFELENPTTFESCYRLWLYKSR
jgi:SAM-dependent methyltransferase